MHQFLTAIWTEICAFPFVPVVIPARSIQRDTTDTVNQNVTQKNSFYPSRPKAHGDCSCEVQKGGFLCGGLCVCEGSKKFCTSFPRMLGNNSLGFSGFPRFLGIPWDSWRFPRIRMVLEDSVEPRPRGFSGFCGIFPESLGLLRILRVSTKNVRGF